MQSTSKVQVKYRQSTSKVQLQIQIQVQVLHESQYYIPTNFGCKMSYVLHVKFHDDKGNYRE